jgi:hypothetical protein
MCCASVDTTQKGHSMKHDAATVEAVLGRKPEEKIRHYEVKCLADSGIGGSRKDTLALRNGNYSEVHSRNIGYSERTKR